MGSAAVSFWYEFLFGAGVGNGYFRYLNDLQECAEEAVKVCSMATSTTDLPATFAPLTKDGVYRRRRISPQAGRALEILGHAIEYLADEYAHEGFAAADHAGRLEAIQLLIKANRGIYFECPEVPGIRERILSWWRE